VAVESLADSGRNVAQLDAPAGVTTLHVLDLPLLTDGVASQPVVMVAAAGASAGWRSAALTQSVDLGASWQAAGTTTGAAILGTALTPLAEGSAGLIDAANTVNVRLLNADMQLNDATDALLLGGSNLAMLGGELFQFGQATPLGANAWRLSRLWRGRRGTEDRITGHSVGDPFTLITAATLTTLSVPTGVDELRVSAQGVGDQVPWPEADSASLGLALRPPSPCALSVELQSNGDRLIRWIRRSRNGWSWIDAVDAPIAEESELYTVTLTPSTGSPRRNQTTNAQWAYTAVDQAADRAGGASSMTISVAQIGTMQSSPSTSLILSLI